MASRKRRPAVERAAGEYRAFHWGDEPDAIVHARAPVVTPKMVLTELGTLVWVVYETAKGGETYEWEHPFEGTRPVLASTPGGRLVVVGGSYRITPRGIVG
jgi:hypothetical protein